MVFLDLFALFILILLAALVLFGVIKLGGLPGKIAQKRGHPQTAAIRIMGWVGIFTGGILWVFALIWAHTESRQQRISRLEARLQQVEGLLNKGKDVL